MLAYQIFIFVLISIVLQFRILIVEQENKLHIVVGIVIIYI